MENIGDAYIRVHARGDRIDDQIEDELDQADRVYTRKGREHGDKYAKGVQAAASRKRYSREIAQKLIGQISDDAGKKYFTDRLLDREDAFGPENIMEIMEALVEEWGARPTQSSSGSTVSPPVDGPRSTPAAPQSISSASLLTGS